jgi:hypothetical protein
MDSFQTFSISAVTPRFEVSHIKHGSVDKIYLEGMYCGGTIYNEMVGIHCRLDHHTTTCG